MIVEYTINLGFTCFRSANGKESRSISDNRQFFPYDIKTSDGTLTIRHIFNLARWRLLGFFSPCGHNILSPFPLPSANRDSYPSLQFIPDSRLTLSWKNRLGEEVFVRDDDELQKAMSHMTDIVSDGVMNDGICFYVGSDQHINHSIGYEMYKTCLDLHPSKVDKMTPNPLNNDTI